MATSRKIVVVGGGPAGVAAALAAKQQDAAAEVTLINDEHHEPYEKPPLSKAVLTGKASVAYAPIAGPKGVAGGGVIFKAGTRIAHGKTAAALAAGRPTIPASRGGPRHGRKCSEDGFHHESGRINPAQEGR